MIGDKLILKPYHLPPAQDIFNFIKKDLEEKNNHYIITIAGESGCGKSTLSIAIKQVLEDNDISSFTIHMDDYFHLPPTSNHQQRLDDINHVGPQEVDLDHLQKHVNDILDGSHEIIKPLIHYKENDKRSEIFYPANFKVIIVEGTYVSLLDNIDKKVFMLRDYKDTWQDRINRARDPITPFIENVLEIEHVIISKHAEQADLLVDKDYNVTAKS